MKMSVLFSILFAVVVLLTSQLFAAPSNAGVYNITLPNKHSDPAIVIKKNPNNKLKITKITPAEKAILKPGEKVIVSFEYSAEKRIQPLPVVRAYKNGKSVDFKTKDLVIAVGPSGKTSVMIQIDRAGVSIDEICMTLLSHDGKTTLVHFHHDVDLKWEKPAPAKYAQKYLGTWIHTIKENGKPKDCVLQVTLDKNSKLTFSYIAGFSHAPVLQECSADAYRAKVIFKMCDGEIATILMARKKNILDATVYTSANEEHKVIFKKPTTAQLIAALTTNYKDLEKIRTHHLEMMEKNKQEKTELKDNMKDKLQKHEKELVKLKRENKNSIQQLTKKSEQQENKRKEMTNIIADLKKALHNEQEILIKAKENIAASCERIKKLLGQLNEVN